MLLFFGCKRSKPNGLNDFLEDIENNTNKINLCEFKNAPNDSIVWFFKKIDQNVYKLLEDSIQVKKLDAYFNGFSQEKHIEYICFALHLKLNDKKFDPEDVLNCLKRETDRVEEKWRVLKEEYENLITKNAKINNTIWHVGDSLTIMLPVEYRDTKYKVARYPANMLRFDDFTSYDDSLIVYTVLIGKQFDIDSTHNKGDTINIYFKLKILKPGKPNHYFYEKKINIMDTMVLDLNAYGKTIR